MSSEGNSDDFSERQSFLPNKENRQTTASGANKSSKNKTSVTSKSSMSKKHWFYVISVLVAFGLILMYGYMSDVDVEDVEEKPESPPAEPEKQGVDDTLTGQDDTKTGDTSANALAPSVSAPVDAPLVQTTSAPVPTLHNVATKTATNTNYYMGSIPKPLTNEDLPVGFKKHPAEVSDTYIRRGKTIDEDERQKLAQTWGEWTFVDPAASTRPETLPTNDYPNSDIPRTAFPTTSWQTDKDYLSKWLPEALAHTERAMEAILAEYGNSKIDLPDKDFTERSFMFNLTLKDSETGQLQYNKKNPPGNGGYASPATLEAIKKRLLHAVMLEDSFIFVMSGHSAAAGHGNHFQQSYTLQVQRILEPVLARLGVYHKSHNFGMGGLGTLQNCMSPRDLFGPDIDIIMWDSSMTEGGDKYTRDVFARMALLTGNRVPVLWGEPDSVANYDLKAPGAGSIETNFHNAGFVGIPKTESAVQVNNLPFAAQYLNCNSETKQICKERRYNSTCWIDRDDVAPPVKQDSFPSGRAGWHPGNREHQLRGRIIAFVILQQLYQGLKEWYDTPDYALPDDAWHVTADYERIRNTVSEMKTTPCFMNENFPSRICDLTIHAASEMLPRYNPIGNSLRSLVKEGVVVKGPNPNLYDPPDVRNPKLDTPVGQVDVLNIIENGIDYGPNRARKEVLTGVRWPGRHLEQKHPITSGLSPGKGWFVSTQSAPDNCDGSYNSFCGRGAGSKCLLSGQNDDRGGLLFDSLSGWIILNVRIKHGVIFTRLQTWMGPGSNKATEGWVCENGATECPEASGGNRRTEAKDRNLGKNPNKCDRYKFEFAIDGKITTYDKDSMAEKTINAQRVVTIWMLLDDPDYTGGEEKDVEVAMRMTGCARETTWSFTHLYYA